MHVICLFWDLIKRYLFKVTWKRSRFRSSKNVTNYSITELGGGIGKYRALENMPGLSFITFLVENADKCFSGIPSVNHASLREERFLWHLGCCLVLTKQFTKLLISRIFESRLLNKMYCNSSVYGLGLRWLHRTGKMLRLNIWEVSVFIGPKQTKSFICLFDRIHFQHYFHV